MQRFYVLESDRVVEVAEDAREGGRGAEVVAGGEEVACVEADADAVFLVGCDEGYYGGEVGEG